MTANEIMGLMLLVIAVFVLICVIGVVWWQAILFMVSYNVIRNLIVQHALLRKNNAHLFSHPK